MGVSAGVDDIWRYGGDEAVLFHAKNVVDWYAPDTVAGNYNLGAPITAGVASVTDSGVQAHTGTSCIAFSITTPNTPDSQAGLNRWDIRLDRELYFSCWLYLPAAYVPNGAGPYWQMMIFGTRSAGDVRNDPVWQVQVENISGSLKPYVVWGGAGFTDAGPLSTDNVSRKEYRIVQPTLPVAQWFKVEAYIYQSKDYDGRVRFTMNGTVIFDMAQVKTAYDYGTSLNTWGTKMDWRVCLVSDGLDVSPEIGRAHV